jgi:peroxiredoxin
MDRRLPVGEGLPFAGEEGVMRSLWLRRCWAWGLFGLVIAALAAGSWCSRSDSNPGNGDSDPQELANFTLLDINPESGTHQDSITVSDYEGRTLLIFFVWGSCPVCRANLNGLAMVIDSLHEEGMTDLVGIGINDHATEDFIPAIGDIGIVLPVLQDTLITAGGSPAGAVVKLLNCTNTDDFLIIDREQYIRKKTRSGEGYGTEVDMSTAEGRTTVMHWVRDIDSTAVTTSLGFGL